MPALEDVLEMLHDRFSEELKLNPHIHHGSCDIAYEIALKTSKIALLVDKVNELDELDISYRKLNPILKEIRGAFELCMKLFVINGEPYETLEHAIGYYFFADKFGRPNDTANCMNTLSNAMKLWKKIRGGYFAKQFLMEITEVACGLLGIAANLNQGGFYKFFVDYATKKK